MSPENDDAFFTLSLLYPNGPWLLTAIPVDRTAGLHTDTRTFSPDTEDEAREWLDRFSGGKYNFYFSVNPPMREMTKKASRTDIKEMAFLHVDIDPRAGEDVGAEQERLKTLLSTNLPTGVPEPTFVIFSGGGYWGFWRLQEPLPIEGSEEKYEEAKLYNLQLELLFNADSCHNVDRIARLPGTVNWPDERKKKKGRTPSRARLVSHNSHSYSLSEFTKAPQVQTNSGFSSGNTVVVSENVQRIESLDELPSGVPDWTKIVIAQGMDPDDPDRFVKEGRSGALWHVVCELTRNEVADDVIYSIITDPDWAISASVIDGSNGRPERYARRQIERAKDFAIDPKLASYNERYAVVQNAGNGKCRIIYEDSDKNLVTQSPADFKAFYSNSFVTIAGSNNTTRMIPAGKWWFEHPKRRSYRRIVFLPGEEVPRDVYNMWRGFSHEAIPGGCCDLYLYHLRDCICSGDVDIFDYLLNWMSMAVQRPNQPGHTAIVLRGKQGAGKGTFAKPFAKLFGRHGKQVTDAKHLVGNFNAHLRDCVVLFADEAIVAGNKQHEATIKTLVTEESLMIEAKGVDASVERNCLHVIMASNDDWVVPMGVDDRRFVVLDVSDEHMQDSVYFTAMHRELSSGGYEALLYMLLTRDISQFDPRKKPITLGHLEQKQFSFRPFERWWYDVLLDGALVDEVLTDGTIMPISTVTWDFNSSQPQNQRKNKADIRRFLRKAAGDDLVIQQLSHRDVKENNLKAQILNSATGQPSSVQRPLVAKLPPLKVLRGMFDVTFGGPYEWPAEPETDDEEAF